MNVLIVGNGAREHALAWKISSSPRVHHLYVAPGNAGTSAFATNLPIGATEVTKLSESAKILGIDLTVIGSETPLTLGIADYFQQNQLPIFGPTRRAAQIEASKIFAKELMRQYGVPTPRAEIFEDITAALKYLLHHTFPVVVKADGLAAGKGVTVATSYEQAETAVRSCLESDAFGEAGRRILIEEWCEGREVSVFAFTDGKTVSSLVAACDYKRAFDGDRGPNTGGMGSYSPPEFWSRDLANQIRDHIMAPVVRGLAREGAPYQGILYGGLILTATGPQVLEFNCRLGDPEAEVILPRLQNDLLDVLLAVVENRLEKIELQWTPEACVGVVIASGGYPDSFKRGLTIHGMEYSRRGHSIDSNPPIMVFHAGTRFDQDEQVITDGGRVLTVVGRGKTLEEARTRVYAATDHIHFTDSFFRHDIAKISHSIKTDPRKQL